MTDADRFRHMLDYARRAVRVLGDVELSDYIADETRMLALERAVEIVGEAAHKTSDPFRSAHPDLPWRKMAGMRHVLAHGYAGIDHAVVFRVVRHELPLVISSLERLLEGTPP